MDGLIKAFLYAKEHKYQYIAVKIMTKDNPEPEVIINSYENFDNKLKYYRNAYTNDLYLKTCPTISIVDVAYGNDYAEIFHKFN